MSSQFPESFLHYIWQSLLFDWKNLKTTKGEAVEIVRPGRLNPDQGPDFLNGVVRIGEYVWHGHIELHIQSEDWYAHRHETDDAYNNTVLHVVYASGKRLAQRADGSELPEVALAGRISIDLREAYGELRFSEDQIPCAAHFPKLPSFVKKNWITRLSIERIMHKAEAMRAHLQASIQDWDQLCWEEIAAMMGGPVNQAAFRELAKRTPYTFLSQNRTHPDRLEAILFGMAGQLNEDGGDEYYLHLQNLWQHFKQKHRWKNQSPISVKFLRMRPPSFPTMRLAQLAAWICQFPRLPDLLSPEGFQFFLDQKIEGSIYWQTHFQFNKPSSKHSTILGKQQKHILLINTLAPLAYLYGQTHGREDGGTILEDCLSTLPPEKNRITRLFNEMDFQAEDALESQGLIQLYKKYCSPKHCLKCSLGNQILKAA